jgi:trafficking protein particle complex subunit 8
MLWRKAGGDAARPATASGNPYDHSTIEGQMRGLADLAFMMQDYETSASTLRLLASDYKQDKAWKQYAGVQVRKGWLPSKHEEAQATGRALDGCR